MFSTITHAVADAQTADRHVRAGAARDARHLSQKNPTRRLRIAAARMFGVGALQAGDSQSVQLAAAAANATLANGGA